MGGWANASAYSTKHGATHRAAARRPAATRTLRAKSRRTDPVSSAGGVRRAAQGSRYRSWARATQHMWTYERDHTARSHARRRAPGSSTTAGGNAHAQSKRQTNRPGQLGQRVAQSGAREPMQNERRSTCDRASEVAQWASGHALHRTAGRRAPTRALRTGGDRADRSSWLDGVRREAQGSRCKFESGSNSRRRPDGS